MKYFLVFVLITFLSSCNKQFERPMQKSNENYNLEEAVTYIGKRVIVSLCQIDDSGNVTYTGFWGLIDSVQQDGILLRIESGIDDPYWLMPPTLQAFQSRRYEVYEFNNGDIVTEVDYEANYTSASSFEMLEEIHSRTMN